MFDSTRQRAQTPLKPAAIYVALVALLSAPLWALIIRTTGHPGPPVFALMWCPAAAALLAARITRRPASGFGWRWPGLPIMASAYAIPLFYTVAAYAALWALGLGRPDTLHYFAATHRAFWVNLPLLATVAVLGNCLTTLGEEIGWRGFLVPVLAERFGLAATALISGAVWAAWHLPLILFGHDRGDATIFGVTCFTTLVLAETFLFAWLRLISGSLWPCMLLHAVHNTSVQSILTPLIAATGQTAWTAGEFGAALPIAATLTAIAILRLAPLRGGWGQASIFPARPLPPPPFPSRPFPP